MSVYGLVRGVEESGYLLEAGAAFIGKRESGNGSGGGGRREVGEHVTQLKRRQVGAASPETGVGKGTKGRKQSGRRAGKCSESEKMSRRAA